MSFAIGESSSRRRVSYYYDGDIGKSTFEKANIGYRHLKTYLLFRQLLLRAGSSNETTPYTYDT
jgi:hypothetical protein